MYMPKKASLTHKSSRSIIRHVHFAWLCLKMPGEEGRSYSGFWAGQGRAGKETTAPQTPSPKATVSPPFIVEPAMQMPQSSWLLCGYWQQTLGSLLIFLSMGQPYLALETKTTAHCKQSSMVWWLRGWKPQVQILTLLWNFLGCLGLAIFFSASSALQGCCKESVEKQRMMYITLSSFKERQDKNVLNE